MVPVPVNLFVHNGEGIQMKKWSKFDFRGEVGIATTLIITSMLLVSGAAATTIIATNNDYQQQAESTAQEAIAGVSTGIEVLDVQGNFQNGAIRSIDLMVRLNYGSPVINLEFLTIILNTDTTSNIFLLNATEPSERFVAKQINIVSGLPKWTAGANCTMGSGDLIKISISGISVESCESATVKFIPARGQQNFIIFTVPDAIVGSVISLR
jgi:archaellin